MPRRKHGRGAFDQPPLGHVTKTGSHRHQKPTYASPWGCTQVASPALTVQPRHAARGLCPTGVLTTGCTERRKGCRTQGTMPMWHQWPKMLPKLMNDAEAEATNQSYGFFIPCSLSCNTRGAYTQYTREKMASRAWSVQQLERRVLVLQLAMQGMCATRCNPHACAGSLSTLMHRRGGGG